MSVFRIAAENRVFYQKMSGLVLPIAFQQFMLAAVSASDALMLGVISQDYLSAVSLAGQITFVFNLFMGALAMGASILAAQYYGRGDMNAVEKIFGYVVKVSFLIGAVFCAASLLFPAQLMLLFTSDPVLIDGGVVYLQIVAASYLFTAVSQMFLCILKNTGFALQCMIIGSSAVVINLVLNACLIFGLGFFPSMNIAGAALATSISKFIELAWAYRESLRQGRVQLHPAYCFHAEQWLSKDFWKFSLPLLGNYLGWGLGFAMYSVIMGHLGNDAVASNSIANIAKNLIVSFCCGLSNGGAIVVGNALGNNEFTEAKRYGALLWKSAIISGLVCGVLLLAILPLILLVTDLTPQAQEYLKWMIVLCACYMVGKVINMTVIAGIFPAGGDPKFGLICDTVTMWCFAVPVGFIAAFWLQLPVVVVFLIINLDEIVKLPAVVIHYRKYKWLRNITRTQAA